MAINFENSVTQFIHEVHEFVDWTDRWGDPRSAREEKVYYDVQNKISNHEAPLKPFVHKLRLALEHFIDDYRVEPHANERIGKPFKTKAAHLLDTMGKCADSMSDEDKALCEEIKKLIKATVVKIS